MVKRVTTCQHITSVTDVLTFGKYKGNKVETVLSDHPEYLEWAMTEKIITVTPEIKRTIYGALTYWKI